MLHSQDSSETPHATVFLSHSATPSHVLKAAANSKPFAVTVEVRAASAERTRSSRLGCRSRALSRSLYRIPLLLAFHTLNSIFGIVACVIVVTGAILSIGLMPVCGFGVVVFQALAVVTEKLAQFDIEIANLIVSIGGADDASDELRVHPGIVSEFTLRLSTEAGQVNDEMPAASPRSTASPQTLLAMLYFATVKLAVSLLSLLIVAFVISFPFLVIPGSGLPAMGLAISKNEFEEKPFACVVTVAGIFTLSLALLMLFAVLSRELTDFVCGDPMPGGEGQAPRGDAPGREGSNQRKAVIGLPLIV